MKPFKRPQPGDVLCTKNPKGWAARLIRLGAALQDRPNTVNHVIVVSHVDAVGKLWGIEGRPGGVGYVHLSKAVLTQPYLLSNALQPKTSAQRELIVEAAKGMIGTPYDWTGIAQDGMVAIGAQRLWGAWEDGTVPAQVVCSSLADWVYDHVGLASPGKKFDRNVSPADWAAFITERGWKSTLA